MSHKKKNKIISKIDLYKELAKLYNRGYSTDDIINSDLSAIKNKTARKKREEAIKAVIEIKNQGFKISEDPEIANKELSEQEIKLWIEEYILQSIIFSSENITIDFFSQYDLGLHPTEEVNFPLAKAYKEAIRVDFSGLVNKIKPNKLSKAYRAEMLLFHPDKTERDAQSHTLKDVKSLLRLFGKKHKSKSHKPIIYDQTQPPQTNNAYTLEDYDFNTSPVWKKVFSKFPRFLSIEDNLRNTLYCHNANPKILQEMTYSDFFDLMYKSMPINQDGACNLFEGSGQDFVKKMISSPQTERKIRIYMRFSNMTTAQIDEEISKMKTNGSTCQLFSKHHYLGVQNAGGIPNIKDINSRSNIMFLSSKMHLLLHKFDDTLANSNFLRLKPTQRHEVMLGFTDLFRVISPELSNDHSHEVCDRDYNPDHAKRKQLQQQKQKRSKSGITSKIPTKER